MKEQKEKTLKQRLQELSELSTPFFKSLTPFAAGYTQGFDCEKKRLVGALMNNVQITKEWVEKPITIPFELSYLYMHSFLDGVLDYRKQVSSILGDEHNKQVAKEHGYDK